MSFYKHATKEEFETILKIVNRAEKLCIQNTGDRLPNWGQVLMDIEFTHCYAGPLRLDDLLKAADPDFVHDVWGIMKHFNRETFKMDDHFVPRFAVQ